MKKIMMTKYGFERWQAEDFSDDGNRFLCYKAGKRVRVSKLVADGEAFVSARIDGNILPYEVYSSLSHYKDLDRLNGVSIDSLTDDDFKKLFEDCLAYEQEYTHAEQTIEMPTIDDIRHQCEIAQANRQSDMAKVEALIKDNILTLIKKLTENQWRNIKYCYNYLLLDLDRYDAETYPEKIVGTRQSIDFCKPDSYAVKGLSGSFHYTDIINTIDKAIK